MTELIKHIVDKVSEIADKCVFEGHIYFGQIRCSECAAKSQDDDILGADSFDTED